VERDDGARGVGSMNNAMLARERVADGESDASLRGVDPDAGHDVRVVLARNGE
jgi:hypothetical protein